MNRIHGFSVRVNRHDEVGTERLVARRAVSSAWSGTQNWLALPTHAMAKGVRLALSRKRNPPCLPCIPRRLNGWVSAGFARHGHLSRPCPRSRSRDPRASFKLWLAASPVMTIMEPRATYCRIIARRSLPHFFDNISAWGPRSCRKWVGGAVMGRAVAGGN
jgi:hypothetical protein